MAVYRILLKTSAAKELERLPTKKERQRIVARIAALASEARPPGAQKLAGHEDRYRIRQGDYRVVYAIDDGAGTLTIVKVGHRKEVYR